MKTNKRTAIGSQMIKWISGAILLALCLLHPAAMKAQWTTPDASQNISNTNSGNVGVKTTTPEFPLQVNNASSNVLGMVYTGTLSTTSGAGIQSLNLTTPSAADQRLGFYTFGVRNGGTSYNPVAIQGFSSQAWTLNSAQGGYLTFSTTPNGSATRVERMRIDHTGNVGIGTTTPNGLLTLRVSAGDVIQSFVNAGGSAGELHIRYKYESSQHRIGWTDSFGNWLFYSQYASPNTSSVGFFPGRVGVGQSNPQYSVDAVGSVNASVGLCIAGDCKTAWSQVGGGGSQWTTAAPNIYFNTGNVGIGTSSPTQKLEINGAALVPTIYGSSAASGALTLQSTSHTTKGTINIGVDQTTTTSIAQSGTPGNKLIVATDRLIVNNAGVRVNGAPDNGDLSVTKVNISNPDALQFRTTNPNITSNGSLLFTVNNVGGDNVKFNVQNSVVSNAFVIDTNGATPAKLLDVRNLGTSKFSISGNGDVTVAGNIAAKYQDVAEWVESSQELTPGTVVVLDSTKSNQVIAATQSYDSRVAGVISLKPGITLGEQGEGRVLVATTGRVKLKVDASNGPIQIGDLLVTSDREGYAMKSQPVDVGGIRIHRPGTLIGKALEPLAKGAGEILVLLSLQ
ncbi:MAG TPA: hypothetical protein VLB46_20925 [Pyrinomonadaceae bacterium]|nr:hypothetical protein [Pyrinomonadaceae bacterium]